MDKQLLDVALLILEDSAYFWLTDILFAQISSGCFHHHTGFNVLPVRLVFFGHLSSFRAKLSTLHIGCHVEQLLLRTRSMAEKGFKLHSR